MKSGWVTALAAVVWGWGTVGAADLPIRRIVRDTMVSVHPETFVGHGAMAGHVPSARNVLKLDRPNAMALPTAESAARQKTVRVAVLRVQFAQETPDNANSTGNGHFDLRDSLQFLAEEGHAFEMAPHNRDFFNTIMRAASRYYEVVSNGRVTLSYDVFPTAKDSAYTVDSTMCYYGSLPPNDGLAYLVIDAVKKADPDPDFNFGDYDVVAIFHAGSDAQHDFSPITPTPCDLYSAFVRLLDPAFFVPVDGGADSVTEAVLLPETQTQDNRGTGLGGVVAHELGHALGLPDLYSTRTGTTQVGDFSLMDNNAQQVGIDFGVPGWDLTTFFDLIPVFPDAWSRAYLGFVDPVVATPDSILARDHVNPDSVKAYILNVAENEIPFTQVLKVPISSREYYLAEFRSPDQDRNTNPNVPFDMGVGIRFDSSFNVVLGPSTCNPQDLSELDSCRVLGRDYDFKWFQPGDPGGMLIWHVDEEVAWQSVPDVESDPFLLNNFHANTLQWDRFRRFLEVEEADGLVDFGGNYFTYYGGQRELFSGSGNHEFGPTTNPSTRSHTGAASGIEFFDISPVLPPDALPLHRMTVKLRRESAVHGWPRNSAASPAPDLTTIGGDTVLTASGRYILGWRKNGAALLNQLPGDLAIAIVPSFDQTTDTLRLSGWARCDTTVVTEPSCGLAPTGDQWVSAVDANGRIYVWRFADANVDGWADTIATFPLGGVPQQAPVWFDANGDGDDEMFVVAWNGVGVFFDGATWTAVNCGGFVRDWCVAEPGHRLFLAEDNGMCMLTPPNICAFTLLGPTLQSIIAIDTDRDGIDEVYGRDATQLYRIDVSGAPTIAEQNDPRAVFTGPLSAGDHDGDGFPNIYCAADDRQMGFQANLSPETGFPLRANDYYSGAPLTAAMVTDDAMFFGGADGEVQAYRPDRTHVAGWPMFVGDTVTSLAVLPSGADSAVVLARSTTGTIWAQRAPARTTQPGGWTQSRATMEKTNRWEGAGVAQPKPVATSLPEESVFAYPNPASRGPVAIRFYLGEASPVELRVYDLAGNEVHRAQTSGQGGMDNEWVWDASDVAPGVYFCRVQAAQGGKEVVEFCKVAIIP